MNEPSDLLDTRRGYDAWSEVYDAEDNPLVELEERTIAGAYRALRGLSVLDVGCGTGRHALRLAAAGSRVTGVDFSTGMLGAARAKPGAESVGFVRADLRERLPFADRSFDAATCCLVTDHVADLAALFGEIRRVCRPGGRVLHTCMHPAMHLREVTARFIDPRTGARRAIATERHDVAAYVMAFRAAGLEVESMSEHAMDPETAEASPRGERYLGWPMLLVTRLRAGRGSRPGV